MAPPAAARLDRRRAGLRAGRDHDRSGTAAALRGEGQGARTGHRRRGAGHVALRHGALAWVALWPMTAPAEVNAPGIFLGHIKVNRDRSLTAKVASILFLLPGMGGLMRKGLEKDYKDNLY